MIVDPRKDSEIYLKIEELLDGFRRQGVSEREIGDLLDRARGWSATLVTSAQKMGGGRRS